MLEAIARREKDVVAVNFVVVVNVVVAVNVAAVVEKKISFSKITHCWRVEKKVVLSCYRSIVGYEVGSLT